MAGRLGALAAAVAVVSVLAVPGPAAPTPAPGTILYIRGSDDDDLCGEIWSVEPDGSERRKLDFGPGNVCDPEWSPDGRRIAFVSDKENDRYRLYVADANGQNAVAVTDPPRAAHDFWPAWSPDGTQIAFERRLPRPSRYRLFVVDADGAHVRQLTQGRHVFDGTPTWSPDGRILFVSDVNSERRRRCSACSSLYVIRLEDGRLSRITRRSVNSLMPAWSPDGRFIAWGRAPDLGAVLRLYVMNSDRTQVRRLDRVGEGPAWAPDSRTLVYESREGLAVIGVDGTGRRQLTRDDASSASWRPVSSRS